MTGEDRRVPGLAPSTAPAVPPQPDPLHPHLSWASLHPEALPRGTAQPPQHSPPARLCPQPPRDTPHAPPGHCGTIPPEAGRDPSPSCRCQPGTGARWRLSPPFPRAHGRRRGQESRWHLPPQLSLASAARSRAPGQDGNCGPGEGTALASVGGTAGGEGGGRQVLARRTAFIFYSSGGQRHGRQPGPLAVPKDGDVPLAPGARS